MLIPDMKCMQATAHLLLHLDLSLPSGMMHVPGTVRGWILPPWEGGPLGCHHVRHSSLAMAKQLPLLWVVLWMPQSQRFPLAVC